MTNSKSTKRSLFSSALAILMCVAMLVGTTFAWFTDTASTAVNKIQDGNLDVALEMKDNGGNWVTAEGKILQFKVNGQMPAEGTQILWEPGCRYELPALRVVNKGNLALKYKVQITGIQGDSFTIKGVMKTTAGNEYQGMSIDGISITVFATQDTVENDSSDNQYDENAGKDTAIYTLSELNALTAIPAGIKNVYLNIGAVSLKNGSVTIGNNDIADVYTSVTGSYTVGQELDDGRKIARVWNADENVYLANSNKPGITLYVSGSVNENTDADLNSSANYLNFRIPDASNIVFTKDFTVNGYFRMSPSFNDNKNLGGGVAAHKLQSVLFDHSTFNGIWIQNGSFLADSITLDGCTFNAYKNTVSANNSNPLWFCKINDCDVTVKNCTFKASRPIKVVEQGVSGAEVKILNNTFDMSLINSANDASEPKNDAIMFSTITNDSTLAMLR